MSLRDWFAGMAMNGMLAARDEGVNLEGSDGIAYAAYYLADAVLKERDK